MQHNHVISCTMAPWLQAGGSWQPPSAAQPSHGQQMRLCLPVLPAPVRNGVPDFYHYRHFYTFCTFLGAELKCLKSAQVPLPCTVAEGVDIHPMRFGGAETSIIAAMSQGRMWEPHYTPQLQCTFSFRYYMLHFNVFIQFSFISFSMINSLQKDAPTSLLHLLENMRWAALALGLCCTFLLIRADVKTMEDAKPGLNTYLENNTGFVKGYRKKRPSLTFWNTLVLSAVIPDTETCWVLGLLVTYYIMKGLKMALNQTSEKSSEIMDQGLAVQFHLWWKSKKQWAGLWHAWISRTSKKKRTFFTWHWWKAIGAKTGTKQFSKQRAPDGSWLIAWEKFHVLHHKYKKFGHSYSWHPPVWSFSPGLSPKAVAAHCIGVTGTHCGEIRPEAAYGTIQLNQLKQAPLKWTNILKSNLKSPAISASSDENRWKKMKCLRNSMAIQPSQCTPKTTAQWENSSPSPGSLLEREQKNKLNSSSVKSLTGSHTCSLHSTLVPDPGSCTKASLQPSVIEVGPQLLKTLGTIWLWRHSKTPLWILWFLKCFQKYDPKLEHSPDNYCGRHLGMVTPAWLSPSTK